MTLKGDVHSTHGGILSAASRVEEGPDADADLTLTHSLLPLPFISHQTLFYLSGCARKQFYDWTFIFWDAPANPSNA